MGGRPLLPYPILVREFQTGHVKICLKPFKGSTRSGGTGLGLAIAAELIAAHGGTITLVDGHQPGACFEIRIPDPQSHISRGEHLRVVG